MNMKLDINNTPEGMRACGGHKDTQKELLEMAENEIKEWKKFIKRIKKEEKENRRTKN